MSDLRARMDADTRRLLDDMAGVVAAAPVPEGADPMTAVRAQARALFLHFAGAPPPAGACTVETLMLPAGGGALPARLYRPTQAPASNAPAALFLHGGGWSVGDLEGYDTLAQWLAVESGAVLLAPEYRLAPEHPFPAALDDSLAAFDWLLAHAADLGLDPARLGVVGDSAGGALAAVVALERRAALAAQVLLYPMTDVGRGHAEYASRGLFGGGDAFLTREAIDAAAAWYLGEAGGTDPRISPIFTEDLAGAPPAYVLVAAMDPLRDEGIAYAERLREAGVPVECVTLEGAIHAALSFGVLESGRRGRTLAAHALKSRLA